MHRVICNFGQVAIDPFWHVVLPLVTLIFLSIGGSYASSRKMKLPTSILIAIIFAVVGNVIAYFIFQIIYQNVQYQGLPLSDPERFGPGTTYPIIIYSYGFMLMIAFIVGTIFLVYEGKKENISSDVVLDMMTFVIVGSIIGARIVYVLLMPEEFIATLSDTGEPIPGAPWWDITRGGLSIHGGILGALLAGMVFCKLKKLSFWKLADFTILALPLGIFFGRIGCYLNGCCFGIKFTEQVGKPWWTKYPAIPMPENVIPPYPWSESMIQPFRHPAPLYMAGAMLLLFFWLKYFKHNKVRFAGHTFLMFILTYSVIRFIQEMYRFDASSKVIGEWLTIAQLASIIIAIISLFIMLEINRRISIAERLELEMAGEEPAEEKRPPPEEVIEEEAEEEELEPLSDESEEPSDDEEKEPDST